jgi:processive 1,2-diacylglycerol beta-glucosyltransferase
VKILLLFAGAGTGHRRAAEALAKALRLERPDADTTVADILDFTPALYRDTYAKGYLRVVRTAPELWGYMYASSDRKAAIPWRRKVRSAFNHINTGSLRSFLADLHPDAVVCTHFMPLEVLSAPGMLRRCPVPRYCVITDIAVHSLWIVHDTHGYFVATEYARRHLVRRGIAADRIEALGIPVDPAFESAAPAADARRKLGVADDLPTALVMGGGFGVGPTLDLLRSFRGQPARLQLLVIAGANEHLRRDAEAVRAELSFPVHVHGFVDNVPELMSAADVVISKPGGLTLSEVMALGKPMVIVDPIPGQEQRNCEYLLEAGAATRVYEMDGAAYRILSLLNDTPRLARMGECARRVGRPRSARDIAGSILRRLPRDAEHVRGRLENR